MKGISLHSIVPVRAEDREGAEQNTQMLFGETCEVMDEGVNGEGMNGEGVKGEGMKGEGMKGNRRWVFVRLDSDGQEGWVDAKMITPMSSTEYKTYHKAYKTAAQVIFPMAYAVSENNGQTIPLTAGTRLTHYQNGRFEVLGVGFRIDANMVAQQPIEMNQENLLQTVRFFLNIPYLWGGKNALGMDCSGFTQIIMSLFGKQLPRNAGEQATQGRILHDLNDIQAGDLVFFDHEGLNDGAANPTKITHVGIAIDPTRVIHCSGRVKVEKLDSTGIYSAEQATYTHHLALIRRA